MNMLSRIATALLAGSLVLSGGCAVTRGQETVGSYIDDSAITARVKTRFINSADVSAAALSVETLNGTVMLSGFAKSAKERATAEELARSVTGVRSIKNDIVVRP